MPYFDQGNLYNQWDFNAPIWSKAFAQRRLAMLQCPSDVEVGLADPSWGGGANVGFYGARGNYVGNGGIDTIPSRANTFADPTGIYPGDGTPVRTKEGVFANNG